jgi:hypothetical protein
MSLFKSSSAKEQERVELIEEFGARKRELKPLSDMQILMLAVAQIYDASEGCFDDALRSTLYERAKAQPAETVEPEL